MAVFHKKNPDIPRRRQAPVGDVRQSPPISSDQNVFRRNRTLTGSTSSSVNVSQRDLQSDLQSPRSHAHHLAMRRRKIGLVLVIVLSVTVALFALLLQFTARVTISVTSTSLSRPVETQLYESAVNDYLGLNPLSRLRFALDPVSLTAYLEQVHPEVDDVLDIRFGSIGETHIVLEMRQPVAGWNINNTQYYVDAQGVAFERNYFKSPSVSIVDDSGVSLEQGTTVASNRFLGFVGRVVALSTSYGYTVTQAILPADTTRQLDIRLQKVGPRVKLSIDRPAGEQVEDMDRALDYIRSVGRNPEYIDVRVSGKAFYR